MKIQKCTRDDYRWVCMLCARKYVWILPLIMLSMLWSCNSKTPAKQGILNREEMARIIADLKIIDAAYQAGISPLSAQSDSILNMEDSAVIDSAQLENNINMDSTAASEFAKKLKGKLMQGGSHTELDSDTSKQSIMEEEYKPYEEEDEKRPPVYAGHVGADYDHIFSQHQTSRAVFEKSLMHYSLRPKELEQILERTLDLLLEKQAEQNEIRRTHFAPDTSTHSKQPKDSL